jgi:hypothetical protein
MQMRLLGTGAIGIVFALTLVVGIVTIIAKTGLLELQ